MGTIDTIVRTANKRVTCLIKEKNKYMPDPYILKCDNLGIFDIYDPL